VTLVKSGGYFLVGNNFSASTRGDQFRQTHLFCPPQRRIAMTIGASAKKPRHDRPVIDTAL
jgi:hypothetical protein